MSDQIVDERSSITLGELLADMSLGIQAVVVPEGAKNQPVSWVHATEQLDPRPHVRAGELVCTLGSALLAEGSHSSFVDAVSDGGAIGICLGLGEVHLVTPLELVEACKRHNIPLLELQHGVPFMLLNDRVLAHRARTLNAQVQQESTLIAELLGLAHTGQEPSMLLERAAARYPGRFERTSSTGLEGGPIDETVGILTWDGVGDAPSAEFLSQLASVLELSIREHEWNIREREQRLGQLMRLLVDGLAHPAALRLELEADGLRGGHLRVSCWPVGSQSRLRGALRQGLIALTESEVIAVTASETDIDELSVELGLVSGFSSEVLLTDIGRAATEARAALRIARRRGTATGPEYLTTFEALLEQQPTARLSAFVNRLIAPIEASGPKVGPELVHTLGSFFANGYAVQATSDAMGVHPNTIRHRLARIAELSGRNPLDPARAVDLRVAVWAWERQRRNAERMVRPLDR